MKTLLKRIKLAMQQEWYRQNVIVVCVGFIVLLSMSVGYSILDRNLDIASEVVVRADKDIRLTGITSNSPGCGYDKYNPKYNENSITINITLPELNCTTEYSITVKNDGTKPMRLINIIDESYNNDDIVYDSDSLNLYDVLLAGNVVTFTFSFKYKSDITILPDNRDLGAIIKFVWEEYISEDEKPVIVDKKVNKQPFIDQVVSDESAVNAYLMSLVKATDVEDGDITSDITIDNKGGFNPSIPGDYDISYYVIDSGGNEVTLTLTVTVWNFIKIVNGQYHCIALGSNGSVWTFGYNAFGQRGIGNTTSASNYRAPTQIPQSYFNNHPVVDIAAGYVSSYALDNTGQAYAWGEGAEYQLGNESTGNQSRPVAVAQNGGIKFTQISSFYRTVAALGTDGNIYTWGPDIYGANGGGGVGTKQIPSLITSTGNFKYVSQGYYGGAAVTIDGLVYVWGTNLEGEIGIGNVSGYNYKPTLVPSLSNVKEVSYGARHVLALTNEGKVYAWGSNGTGRLGLGDSTTRSTPVLISSLSGVSKINAGFDFSQFKVNNNIYSAGYANYGELFAGNTTTRDIPYLSNLANVNENVGYIAGKYDNAFILSANGKAVYGIGYCDATGQEFGSIAVQAISNSAAISWSFTPNALP